MKHYKVIDPDENSGPIVSVLSEQDILDFYWEYWYEAMVRIGKRGLISPEHCIMDWVTTNWAEEVGDCVILEIFDG